MSLSSENKPAAREHRSAAIFHYFRAAGESWIDDKAMRLGASLAFYAAFAIGPLLLIAISIAGLVFGADVARNHIMSVSRGMIGPAGASAIAAMIEQSATEGSSVLRTIIGVVVLFIGATGFFGELEDALDTIWGVKPRPGSSVRAFLKSRFLSFTMVLGTGFLLLVSLILSALLHTVGEFFSASLPGGAGLWEVVNTSLSLLVSVGLFALIFKVLPRVRVRWREVWLGAILTGVLFELGKLGLSFYVEQAQVGSAHGAAGSLVVLLVWVYYSAQILFFGAEFTKAVATKAGAVQLKPGVVRVGGAARFVDEHRAATYDIERSRHGHQANEG